MIDKDVKTFLKEFKIENIKNIGRKNFLPKNYNTNKLLTNNLMKQLYQLAHMHQYQTKQRR